MEMVVVSSVDRGKQMKSLVNDPSKSWTLRSNAASLFKVASFAWLIEAHC